jgi:alpha-mannosidase
LNILNKETNVDYQGLHYFEDRSEVGDHANHRAADEDEIITSIGAKAEISKIFDGPIFVQYRIKTVMMLPPDALKDRSRRNPEKIPYEIVSFLTLKKGARFLEVRTEINNQIRDHKLRAMFPSGYQQASQSFSETHFDVTERDIRLPDSSTWKEPMLPYYPQYMFCGVGDGKNGLAILNIGLPEYAVHDDKKRTIGLTLIRTYRFPIIGADPEDVATDETQVMCQCLRRFTFDYAIYPYAGNWDSGQVFRYANQFNLKLRLNQAGKSHGNLSPVLGFIKIDPEQLVLSAVKKSSRQDSLIVRVFNPTEQAVTGTISFWKKILMANQVDLNEKFIAEAVFDENSIKINVTKNKIITIEVCFK